MSNVIDLGARRAAKQAPAPAAELDAPLPAAMQQAIEQNFAQIGFAHSLVGQALHFYANQGFDHGQHARVALAAMNGALELVPGETQA
jgi:hypothetical protein